MNEWMNGFKKKKQDPTICCLQEPHFSFEDTHRLRVNRCMEILQQNGHQKKARAPRLISDKTDFKLKVVKKIQRRSLYHEKEVSPSRRYSNWKYL